MVTGIRRLSFQGRKERLELRFNPLGMLQGGGDLGTQLVTESPPESVDRHLEGRLVHPGASSQCTLVSMLGVPR